MSDLSNRQWDLLKDAIVSELPATEQRKLLLAFYQTCGPRTRKEGPADRQSADAECSDFAEQLFSGGRIDARTYCYLAFCARLLMLASSGERQRSRPDRLWGYIVFSSMNEEQHSSFARAYQADLTSLREKHGVAFPVPTAEIRGEEAPKNPLKNASSSMFRAFVWDLDRNGLRDLVSWIYSVHEPYLDRLLRISLSDDQWLANIAELIPRLLLKNLLPIYDGVAVRPPQISIFERAPAGTPHAYHDPGVLTQSNSFIRSLFSEKEIAELEQRNQRIEELFAHSYALVIAQKPTEELAATERRILTLSKREGRIRGMQHLETLYRYKLRIPTWLYQRLRKEILLH
jgi:hypothetical protein